MQATLKAEPRSQFPHSLIKLGDFELVEIPADPSIPETAAYQMRFCPSGHVWESRILDVAGEDNESQALCPSCNEQPLTAWPHSSGDWSAFNWIREQLYGLMGDSLHFEQKCEACDEWRWILGTPSPLHCAACAADPPAMSDDDARSIAACDAYHSQKEEVSS